MINFYDATKLDQEQLTKILAKTQYELNFVKDCISLDNIDPRSEIISVFVTSTVTKEMIDKLPNLKMIVCRSTGFNNIDLQAAGKKGILVTNVPTYGEDTVAEYTFTLLLSLVRKIQQVVLAQNQDISQSQLIGHDVAGKTIGVIGAGHIGQHAIKIANGFSMNVIAYDAMPKYELEKELRFKYVGLDELLSTADYITLHAPYVPTTHHIINSENLKLVKKEAIIINTSRGELIDTLALTEALSQHKIAGAALDVVEGESMLSQHEEVSLLRSNVSPGLLRHSIELSILKKMPNVILSPHNAFNTVESVGRINTTTANNITSFYDGKANNVVKPKLQTGKLIISRHAESEWNASGQWSGITDVHLSEKGFRESIMLARALQSFSLPLQKAYCSQQIRTRETLEGMLNASQQFDIDIQRSAALNERDYGDYTGKNKWEMKELLGDEMFDSIRRGWDTPIPNGESLKMVYERVVPFYTDIILPELKSGNNVLLVAHGNSIRALMKFIESISDDNIKNLEMMFGEILVYDVDENGKSTNKHVAHIDSPAPNA